MKIEEISNEKIQTKEEAKPVTKPVTKMGALNKIGALWVNKDKNGQDYLSGEINNKKVLIFKNGFKENKQPDFNVYEK